MCKRLGAQRAVANAHHANLCNAPGQALGLVSSCPHALFMHAETDALQADM